MQYVKLVVKLPWLFVLFPLLLASVLLAIIIFASELPFLSEPEKGFETRRTSISNKLLAYELLLEKSDGFNDFSNLPIKKTSRQEQDVDGDDDDVDDDLAYEELNGFFNYEEEKEKHFFCGSPQSGYVKLVYENTKGNSLFGIKDLKSMCLFEEKLIKENNIPFVKSCDKVSANLVNDRNTCCMSWSFGNYVALLSGKSSCKEVTESDLFSVMKMITTCLNITEDNFTNPESCPKKHLNCTENLQCSKYVTYIEDMIHYIMDTSFSQNIPSWQLTNSVTFLPLSRGVSSKEFYYSIGNTDLSRDDIKVAAMDFDLKYLVFDDLLVRDAYLCTCGIVCISLLLFFYTGSFLITLGTFLQIFVSLIFTYSAYKYIFRFSFFPFLNLLTIVILIATGVDNTFVIHHIWCQLKLPNHQSSSSSSSSSSLHDAMKKTLNHAFKSLFVTSATTSAAFFSGFVSDVVVLKCFAIFSGTSLVFHFFVAITMMPAVIVLHVKCSVNGCYYTTKCQSFCTKLDNTLADLFQTCIFQLVTRFKWIWVCLFSSVGLISFFIVAVSPKLKLPTSNNFKLFTSSHPFEIYESTMKNKFAFENLVPGSTNNKMPLRFVWGVNPDEDVSTLDPDDEGRMILDETFDVSTPAAQQFLSDFCRKIRMTEYFEPQPGMRLNNCFIERFRNLMSKSCRDFHGKDLKPCCSSSKFPYSKEVFKQCLSYFLPKLARDSTLDPDYNTAGLRFNANYSKIVGLVVEFTSNQTSDPSYTAMQKFYNSMNGFTDVYIQYNAPPEMRKGWFVSNLQFYDLQHSLVVGTPISLFLSIAVAATFAFITTRNIIITGLAMVSISTSIMVTIAILVLSGWELEVFESMSISLAVGMSIDYALHYGIAYQHAQGDTRHSKVGHTIQMSSAVALAGVTTFFVGMFMMPSVVLAYRQLAIFLMTVTSMSWMCSTLFYLSLLILVGPRGTFGELKCCKCFPCKSTKQNSDSNSPNLSSTGTIATTMNTDTENKLDEATELVGIKV